METKYYCPQCGTELKQGQYNFDENTGNLHVCCCPNCDCEGEVVVTRSPLCESTMTEEQINAMEETLVSIRHSENLVTNTAAEKVMQILRTCTDNKLSFTDDEQGDDLTCNVAVSEMNETRLVNSVRICANSIVLQDDCGEDWHPWEVDVPYSVLLGYMISELKRERDIPIHTDPEPTTAAKKPLIVLFGVGEYSLDELRDMSPAEKLDAAKSNLDCCDIYTTEDFCASINNGEDCLTEYYVYPVYVDETEYNKWWK
jgi:hypothetical protein